MSFDPDAVLKDSGGKDDSDINLLNIALALAAPDHQGIVIDRYFQHGNKLIRDVGERFDALIAAGAADDAQARLAALKHILHDREDYRGDIETYNDLQNADIMRVIDRRRGMPIALSLLYIHVGRAQGWSMSGLNFPGHFLSRVDHGGVRLIFDAFEGCRVMDAPALRDLVKRVRGPHAELSGDYYMPCTNRELLLRLQNNVKSRLIEAEDYAGALKHVERMRVLAPDEYRLLLDAGVLYARTGQPSKARDVLEKYVAMTPDPQARREATAVLQSLPLFD